MCMICDESYKNQNVYEIFLKNCNVVTKIPNCKNCHLLTSINCKNIHFIPQPRYLMCLWIDNCDNYYNIHTRNNQKIDDFFKINKIKQWYKKCKYYKQNIPKIYELIEWIEQKRMNPNSKYFQNLIKDF